MTPEERLERDWKVLRFHMGAVFKHQQIMMEIAEQYRIKTWLDMGNWRWRWFNNFQGMVERFEQRIFRPGEIVSSPSWYDFTKKRQSMLRVAAKLEKQESNK